MKNKLKLGYDFLGEQSVKNFFDEVRVYRDAEAKEPAAEAARMSDEAGPAAEVQQAQERPAPDADAVARFRYEAGRIGIVVAFLFGIDVLTGLGDWWFQWPALATGGYLALGANKVFGPGLGLSHLGKATHHHAHHWDARELRFGDLEGGITIEENMRLFGTIRGDARIADGVSFKMTGTIEGNLTVGRGAEVRMMGNIEGDVIDEAGDFHIIGVVEGTRRPATAG